MRDEIKKSTFIIEAVGNKPAVTVVMLWHPTFDSFKAAKMENTFGPSASQVATMAIPKSGVCMTLDLQGIYDLAWHVWCVDGLPRATVIRELARDIGSAISSATKNSNESYAMVAELTHQLTQGLPWNKSSMTAAEENRLGIPDAIVLSQKLRDIETELWEQNDTIDRSSKVLAEQWSVLFSVTESFQSLVNSIKEIRLSSPGIGQAAAEAEVAIAKARQNLA